MTSVLDDLEPTVAFAIWGYDLRGSWVLEFAALIAEGHDSHGTEWDRPEWRRGELWHGEEQLPIPFAWALPWVSDIPPSRSMWRRS
jgi:hypothetical protein